MPVGLCALRFSYASGMPGAEGKRSCSRAFRSSVPGGLIARYAEAFDRGMALAQQDFAAERIKKVLLKLAARQNAGTGRRSIWRGLG